MSPLHFGPHESTSDKDLHPFLDVLIEDPDTTPEISSINHFDWGKFVEDYSSTHPTETGVLMTPMTTSNPFAPPTATHSSSSAYTPSTESNSKKRAADYARIKAEERAKKLLGPDATAADYNRLKAEERAKKLVGPDATAADYKRLKDTERAKRLLGPDATPTDYKRLKETELAKKLVGPDATAADYARLKDTERAKKLLGPDATPTDYKAYMRAIREDKLPKNATAEQYWEYDKTRPKMLPKI